MYRIWWASFSQKVLSSNVCRCMYKRNSNIRAKQFVPFKISPPKTTCSYTPVWNHLPGRDWHLEWLRAGS